MEPVNISRVDALPEKRRLGRFFVSSNFIEHWSDMLSVMDGLFVVEARHCFARCGIEYTAFSKQFDEVEGFVLPPEYEPLVTLVNPETKECSVEWKRIKA